MKLFIYLAVYLIIGLCFAGWRWDNAFAKSLRYCPHWSADRRASMLRWAGLAVAITWPIAFVLVAMRLLKGRK